MAEKSIMRKRSGKYMKRKCKDKESWIIMRYVRKNMDYVMMGKFNGKRIIMKKNKVEKKDPGKLEGKKEDDD